MDYFNLLYKISNSGAEINPRRLKIKELIDEKLSIESYNFVATEPSRPLQKSLDYWLGELAWYMSGNRSAELIAPYSKFWDKIKNPDGTLNSNYGNLVYYKKRTDYTPFNWALNCLIKDKNSRQAMVLYNDREFYFDGNQDYICSQGQHFLIRDNKLICIIWLRSSDIIYGLNYNMAWWSMVHQDLFLSLKPFYPSVGLGNITVNIDSAHLYENHFELAAKMIREPKEYYFIRLLKPIPLNKEFEWYKENVRSYVLIEKAGASQ